MRVSGKWNKNVFWGATRLQSNKFLRFLTLAVVVRRSKHLHCLYFMAYTCECDLCQRFAGTVKGRVIGPKNYTSNNLEHGLILDGCSVDSLSSVRNLGVLFDSNLSFESHVSSICKTAFFILKIYLN